MKRFVVLSFLLILSGCASGSHTSELHVGPKELPATIDSGITGQIVVLRINSFFGILVDQPIYIDRKYIFSIGSSEYKELHLPQGEHSITLETFQWDGLFVGMSYEQILKFNVTDLATIYFLVTPWSYKGAKIQLSNETEAKRHIQGSKFINLEN